MSRSGSSRSADLEHVAALRHGHWLDVLLPSIGEEVFGPILVEELQLALAQKEDAAVQVYALEAVGLEMGPTNRRIRALTLSG